MSATTVGKHAFRLLLTGGGTGGHLFPAVATAEKLVSRLPESAVFFVGTGRRLDRQHLEHCGFAVRTIHSYGLKGKRPLELFKALAVLPVSLVEACWQILRFRPDVVCGVGGYVTGPVVAAAWLLRRPTVIHEQNSIPGLANRQLGRFVDRICISLPDSARFFPAGKTRLTGNPVRGPILEVLQQRTRPAGDTRTLLVLGGSQGAHRVNELVCEALATRAESLGGLRVIHQTGASDEAWVGQRYRQAGIDCQVAAFFNDMADVYRQADLVVSRAGATTLAEISVLGLPAILIPYPHAADDHQQRNARWYADSGGATVFAERELTAERLGEQIAALLGDRHRLRQMSTAMAGLGIADAADRIVDICLAVAGR